VSIQPTFASAAEARKAGWFSRRHQTNDAHRRAQENWRMDRELKREREREQAEATRRLRTA
jgi:hypothetical protein